MTTSQLSEKIYVTRTTSYGHYKVEIEFRGKKHSCISTNSMAFDAHNDEDAKGHYTMREALIAFWDECKIKNNLR